MKRSKLTRLEKHREKYKSIEGMCELLPLDSLDKDESDIISKEILKNIKNKKEGQNIYQIYINVLSEWGIMCPHPQNKRVYKKGNKKVNLNFPVRDIKWYKCECCGCLVINEEYSE